jgi:hypothetical protein
MLCVAHRTDGALLAAHCLFEGMRAEALTLLSAIRKRHDGSRRNPYNEIENGDLLGHAGTIAIRQLAVASGLDEPPRAIERATLAGRVLSLTTDASGAETLGEVATLDPGDTLSVEIAEL